MATESSIVCLGRALGCMQIASTAHAGVFLGGTIYGAVDGSGRPSVAAVLGPEDHPRQQTLAVDCPGGAILGDHPWHDRTPDTLYFITPSCGYRI